MTLSFACTFGVKVFQAPMRSFGFPGSLLFQVILFEVVLVLKTKKHPSVQSWSPGQPGSAFGAAEQREVKIAWGRTMPGAEWEMAFGTAPVFGDGFYLGTTYKVTGGHESPPT